MRFETGFFLTDDCNCTFSAGWQLNEYCYCEEASKKNKLCLWHMSAKLANSLKKMYLLQNWQFKIAHSLSNRFGVSSHLVGEDAASDLTI